MIFEKKEMVLKDGRCALLRSPTADDAAAMIEYLRQTSGETDFLMRYPEECDIPLDKEISILSSIAASPDQVMILCELDGDIAGNCQISFNTKIKTFHRSSVAIAIKKKYWELGIGSAMFRELVALAEKRDGVTQIELEVIEGNTRAMALYEKFGFSTVSEKPDAVRLKDGTLLKEFLMIRKL